MKVLIVGGGGREHALAWHAARSQGIERVYVAPGNAGTESEPGVTNVPVGAEDAEGLERLARDERIDLTVVGPEAPLVAGLADRFREAGLPCFGPSAAAARLEGSKAFAKTFMTRQGIATPGYERFTDAADAEAYIRSRPTPLAIKADGLAAGKGVVIAGDTEEAVATARQMLTGERLGEAGREIVIEDAIEGEEVSFIAMVDGENILPLASSQDYKRRDDGDQGPNTGGMGAYSPAPVVDDTLRRRIMAEIIEPTVRGMAERGTPYTGFLYAGLMITSDGNPQVLEYNCRLGDPEAQALLFRLRSDFAGLCRAAVERRLAEARIDWDPRPALGVVMAADGYPGSYPKGDVITGAEPAAEDADVKVFHAGTAHRDGELVTAGGRVLCVTALGAGLGEARDRAYGRLRGIRWDGAHYRADIGARFVRG